MWTYPAWLCVSARYVQPLSMPSINIANILPRHVISRKRRARLVCQLLYEWHLESRTDIGRLRTCPFSLAWSKPGETKWCAGNGGKASVTGCAEWSRRVWTIMIRSFSSITCLYIDSVVKPSPRGGESDSDGGWTQSRMEEKSRTYIPLLVLLPNYWVLLLWHSLPRALCHINTCLRVVVVFGKLNRAWRYQGEA